MLRAPAVTWEISAPPTMPRGVPWSGPGLMSLIAADECGTTSIWSWPLGGGLVVDLEGGVADVEPLVDQALEAAAQLVAVVAGPHHDVGRQGREPGGHLPHVQVVDLHHARVGGQGPADLLGIDARGRRLHEHAPGLP